MQGYARRWVGIGRLHDYGEGSGIDDFALNVLLLKHSWSNPTLSADFCIPCIRSSVPTTGPAAVPSWPTVSGSLPAQHITPCACESTRAELSGTLQYSEFIGELFVRIFELLELCQIDQRNLASLI